VPPRPTTPSVEPIKKLVHTKISLLALLQRLGILLQVKITASKKTMAREHIQLRPDDRCIYDEIFNKDEYGLIREMDLGPVPRVCDIGAHCGLFTNWIKELHPNAHVVAVEPAMLNVRALIHNTADFLNVQILPCAVGDDTRVDILNTGGQSFQHTLLDVGGVIETSHEKVPILSIHRVVTMFGPHKIDLMKIDADGAEEEILSECSTWIPNHVRYMVVECHRRWMPKALDFERLYKILNQNAINYKSLGTLEDRMEFLEILP
jgi:FkbM family methyltransferase